VHFLHKISDFVAFHMIFAAKTKFLPIPPLVLVSKPEGLGAIP
jgi:hypothetical protein